MRTSVVLASVLLVSCGAGELTLPATTMRFEIVRATTDGFPAPATWPVTELAVDGNVSIEGERLGWLRGDRYESNGGTMARLDGDRIVIREVVTDGTIDDEGSLRNGSGDELRIDLEGRVHGTRADAPELRVTPITPETRRTAMFVVVVGLLSERSGHVSVGAIPAP